MAMKKQPILLTVLILGLVMLSACGTSASPGSIAGTPVATPAATPAQPDQVRIFDDEPVAPSLGELATPTTGVQPTVTLSDVALVRQLYATIFSLPELPPDRPCTAERGPHYTLTFLQGTTTVASVVAKREGCGPVTIAGESQIREASNDFWQQLDQAILTATPPLNPDRLAVATAAHPTQAPQSAMIASAATAEQVYDAILALPRSNTALNCVAEPQPTYQLVFFQGDQALPASVNEGCGMIEMDGGFQWRGGWFSMNDDFKKMLQGVLAGVTFAPAQPDHLEMTVSTAQVVGHYASVNKHQLMLDLYAQLFTLPGTSVQQGCPPNSDKLAGKGTHTTLVFTQWNLPLVQVDTYEGSCSSIQLNEVGMWLQGNQTFWDLLHRVQAP